MKVVKVLWVDSCNSNLNWTVAEDVEVEPMYIDSFGVVVKDTDEFLAIAQNHGDDPEQYSNITTIPKGCIKEVFVIHEDNVCENEQKPTEEYNITGIGSKNAQGKLGEMIKNLKPVNEVLEQKPADKVKPKFHEGEWVVYMGTTAKILDLQKYYYVGKDTNDKDFAAAYCHEYVMKKWDISDAKDGDVLYSLDSKQPFIFKHRSPNEQAEVYCGINIYGKFFVGNTKDCIITTDKYVPATKEQRDILMKAMTDAGFYFDFDKKELKKL